MALMFLEAIVDVGKAADAVTIEKLKSHSKVDYQDHPMGEASCSTCSMFTPAEKSADNEPHCSLVRDVSPYGWCKEYDAHDRSDDVREQLEGMLGVKIGDDGSVIAAKAFDPNEPRDEQGRWATTSSADGGTRWQSGRPDPRLSTQTVSRELDSNLRREERQQARDEKQIREAEQRIADLQAQLSAHSQDKSEDLYWGVHQMLQQARADLANLRSRTASFGKSLAEAMSDVPSQMTESVRAIEKARTELMTAFDGIDASEKMTALRNAIAGHLQATADVLEQIDREAK